MDTSKIDSLRKLFDNRGQMGVAISKGGGSYRIDSSELVFEEGFNPRLYDDPETIAHIEKLVDAIRRGEDLGLFKVFVKDGKILARDGHCRSIAIEKAKALGLTVPPILINEVDAEIEAKCPELVILSSNNNLKLKPLQRAEIYVRIIDRGFDTKYLAGIEGVSEVAIRNLIKAHSLPEDVKALINEGVVSVTTALDLYKDHKDNLGNVIRSKMEEVGHASTAPEIAAPVIKEEQLTIFSAINSAPGDMSPKIGNSNKTEDKSDDWDVLSNLEDKSCPEITAHNSNEVEQKDSILGNGKIKLEKPRLTRGDFGAKTIKGDQAKSVISIFSKLVAKIENISHEEMDGGSISLNLDQELIEVILSTHKKLKG